MGFLAPWFLGGLAALGVPVFVHLLRRHVTTPRPVSSLMFFERGTQSSTRHRRLRYLLLVRAALRAGAARRAGIRQSICAPLLRPAPTTACFSSFLTIHSACAQGTRFADAKQQALATLAAKPQRAKGANHRAWRPA